MFTILAIVLGFVLVSAAMRATDRLLARRIAAPKPAVQLSYRLD